MIRSHGSPYPNAIYGQVGSLVQHEMIIKNYVDPNVRRYAPPDLAKAARRRIMGIRDLAALCTSHIERFNCTTRRFCRLTLAFSKKLDNLKADVNIYIAYYNCCWMPREHGKSGRLRPTPAMMAGIVGTLWKFDNLYDEVIRQ